MKSHCGFYRDGRAQRFDESMLERVEIAGVVREDIRPHLELNQELSEIWPNITEKKDPPDDAEEWDGKPDKREMLER